MGHISVGDELRRLISEGKVDEMTVDYVRRGEPLPVDKLLPVLEKAIKEVGGENAILLDGFPRRLNQIESVEEKVGRIFHIGICNTYLVSLEPHGWS